jgi:hypothetical protein
MSLGTVLSWNIPKEKRGIPEVVTWKKSRGKPRSGSNQGTLGSLCSSVVFREKPDGLLPVGAGWGWGMKQIPAGMTKRHALGDLKLRGVLGVIFNI